MTINTMTHGSASRRGTRAWGQARRLLCKTPTGMLASAAMLRTIDGPAGRKLYGGKVPERMLRRTLAIADALEREAARWESERREVRNAARRVRKEPLRVAA